MPRVAALFLTSLLCGVAALRKPLRQKFQILPALRHLKRNTTPFRQVMNNYMDLQYHTAIQLGGQTLEGIVDTGSFELVVFSKNCQSCGVAAHFSEDKSSTYTKGKRVRTHSYGSGSCDAVDGTENLTIGPLVAGQQAIWLATSCSMPLLSQASFHAIVGVGPPGQPAYTAETMLEQIDELERKYKASGSEMPEDLLKEKVEFQQDLEAASKSPSMLESFGAQTFSTCYGRASGSPAWLVWNDFTRAGVPGVSRIPVIGNITWSVVLEHFALEQPNGKDIVLGCGSGTCAAIVDTGTSLMGVPSEVFQVARQAIEQGPWELDCGNLAGFPDLVMNIGGTTVRLPPSSYIGTMYGSMSKDVQELVGRNALGSIDKSGSQCSLLLMDIGSETTTVGPMFILGMPFFRDYYTTFDLGTGRGNRSLFISPASEECEPDLKAESLRIRSRDAVVARRVDASKLRIPNWLKQRRVL